MNKLQVLKSALVGGASVMALVNPSCAKVFDIPDGDLASALNIYMRQSGVQLVYMDNVRGHWSRGAKGDYTDIAALTQILRGTGFTAQTMPSSAVGIVPVPERPRAEALRVAAAAPRAPAPASPATIETVVVTAQKKSENIQNVPIAVTALSQAQLTERQIAGGPDLVKEVPNLTFSKTNFTGYNIEIRGIGTQAISVTTDPAVAVAFNGTPFIRNHFFEQEFYDLEDVEVLRGPQGTLYGRNATAGVVNLKSALPTDQYEAMLSADLGNFSNRRLEGMINIPIVGDKLDIRLAGEWTRRDGYSFNTYTNAPIDGRDLWSGRLTIGWKPISSLQTYFVWEHFSENDDRLRSGKQLCKTDFGPGAAFANNQHTVNINGVTMGVGPAVLFNNGDFYIQGCAPTSLYSPDAFEAPLGYSLPYIIGPQSPLGGVGVAPIDPYASEFQSRNLRMINSSLNPIYHAKNDTLEFNADYALTPTLTLTSQTGYNQDFLWSTEDFNRFGSTPGLFGLNSDGSTVRFCDPQLGCSDRLIVQDLSDEHAWQLNQEFRLASNFAGPFNFSAGANYLHYETVENYWVFINTVTAYVDNGNPPRFGYEYDDPASNLVNIGHTYVDPNPISHLDGNGHNYFRSENPYVLNSYAAFGEAYYNILSDLKLTGGLRWTVDQKHFLDIPSWVAADGYGYPVTGVVDQQWDRLTGRAVVDWTPKLDFTDQTLIYGSYAHGYKAGGANPPGAIFFNETTTPVHPLTFKPDYIEAFELGTKNTLLNGSLTVNGDLFYYNYTGYQISEIVDRTAINNNYNAHVEGAELESNWEPLPGLKFAFAGGYENTGIAGGTEAVDLIDRLAGHTGWYISKPFVNEASNCVFPGYVADVLLHGGGISPGTSACAEAYVVGNDPLTFRPYTNPPTLGYDPDGVPPGYMGFDPHAGTPGDPYVGQNTYNGVDYGPAPNNGQGFSKNLGGNQLPNAPHFTTSLSAEYTLPVSEDWAATLHSDLYWQSQSWWRVFNDLNYDKLHGYSNVNLALILTNASGWQVMGYVKNVFDTTAITGAFLNSDDTGLTTNIFLTDPRLYGVRVTKQFDQSDGFWGNDYSGYDFFTGLFSDIDNGRPPLWIELGGDYAMLDDNQQTFAPPFLSTFKRPISNPIPFEHTPRSAFDYSAKVDFTPDGTDWIFSAAIRYGRTGRHNHAHQQTKGFDRINLPTTPVLHRTGEYITPSKARYFDAFENNGESHEIFDFTVGKDVGLGVLGLNGSSQISGGLRFVQFNQSSAFSIHADPDYTFIVFGPKYQHQYFASEKTRRSFHGVGPIVSWNASTPVEDSTEANGISIDWGANLGMLFGRQMARVHHQTTGHASCRPILVPTGGCHFGTVVGSGLFRQYSTHYSKSANSARSRKVAVPSVGALIGLSWHYANAKVSFGYRADEFFGAMDGGIDTRKSENVGFFGPYANISIGLGG